MGSGLSRATGDSTSGPPRPTIPEDVPAILDLIQRIFDEYGLIFDPHGFDAHLRDPGAYFRQRGGEFWVAEDDSGRIVATAGVLLRGTVAELKSLYVDRGVRRQGWARRLLGMTIAFARERGCARFEAWSDTKFTVAHRFYRALGFTQRGERAIPDLNDSREYGFFIEVQ